MKSNLSLGIFESGINGFLYGELKKFLLKSGVDSDSFYKIYYSNDEGYVCFYETYYHTSDTFLNLVNEVKNGFRCEEYMIV